jgi:hypothetical protein
MFPGFRKVIATFLVLAAIGFTIIYGPLLIIAGIPTGYGNFVFWLFFAVIGFIVFYAFVYRKNSVVDFNSSEKTVISCVACNQKLRVPVGREIEIKCPNCGISRVIKL